MLEIADRQRALDGYPGAAKAATPAPAGPLPRARTQEFNGLEQQLRQINAQIETLNRPCAVDQTVSKVVDTLRDDLAEIGAMLQDAMPRKAVEALESEMRKLAERIDRTRQSGADAPALGGVERGLAEVRDALRTLTPAESLAGVNEAVQGLAAKIDALALGQQDPAAIKQLEGAIVAMRGIVSHAASNDALTTLAGEVRSLAAKVDQATSDTDVLSTLERRIGTLADALEARGDSRASMPPEFETVVKSLGEKIERLQLNPGNPAVLGHLEDRIVNLVEKLDASDARLNHLEAIERGLAELLIRIEHDRVPQLARAGDDKQPPARVDALQRDLVSLQQVERKTQDSLEAVQGALGDVVDRLAMIETEIRGKVDDTLMTTAKAVIASAAPAAAARKAMEPKPVAPAAPAPVLPEPAPEPIEFSAPAAAPAAVQAPAPQAKSAPVVTTERRPIDPNLPPDHPLEPGSGVARGRYAASPADRIAASEAALGSTKPPVIADPGGKSNFIAAARRAAQTAAAAEAPARKGTPTDAPAAGAAAGGKLAGMVRSRARMVLVAISVVVIVLGSLNMVRSLLSHADEEPESASPGKVTSVPAPEPETAPAVEAPSAPAEPVPGRQSSLFPTAPVGPFNSGVLTAEPATEVTGAIAAPVQSAPAPAPAPAQTAAVTPAAPPPPAAPASAADKLPQAIGSDVARRRRQGRSGRPVRDRAALCRRPRRTAKSDRSRGVVRARRQAGAGAGAVPSRRPLREGLRRQEEPRNRAPLLCGRGRGRPRQGDAQSRRALCRRHRRQARLPDRRTVVPQGRGLRRERQPVQSRHPLCPRHRGRAEPDRGLQVVRAGRPRTATRNPPRSATTWPPASIRSRSKWRSKRSTPVKVEPQPEAATQVKSPAGGWDGSAAVVPLVTPAGKRKPPAVGPRLDLASPKPAN